MPAHGGLHPAVATSNLMLLLPRAHWKTSSRSSSTMFGTRLLVGPSTAIGRRRDLRSAAVLGLQSHLTGSTCCEWPTGLLTGQHLQHKGTPLMTDSARAWHRAMKNEGLTDAAQSAIFLEDWYC